MTGGLSTILGESHGPESILEPTRLALHQVLIGRAQVGIVALYLTLRDS